MEKEASVASVPAVTSQKAISGRISRAWLRVLLMAIGINCFLLALIEGGCYLALRNPQLVPRGPLLQVLRATLFSGRELVQYRSECARYDDELTYTLRPGVCTFKNIEFDVKLSINSLGLRDDELSLRRPEIIVLGDSHAMGWGVEQGQTFAQIIEKNTGRSVLNAAISSYGTAREMIMLRRIDRRNVNLIIFQYCSNDFMENMYFNQHNYKIEPMSRETYAAIVHDLKGSRRYFPGRFVARTLEVQVFRRLHRLWAGSAVVPDALGPAPRAKSPDLEADIFLKSIANGGVDLRGIPIIVIAIDSYRPYRSDFLLSVRERAKRFGFYMYTLDLGGRLSDQDFFRLDDHLSPAGHKVVAEEVIKVIPHILGADHGRCCGDQSR